MTALSEKTATYRAACAALVIAQGLEDTLRQRLSEQNLAVAACKDALKSAERAVLEEARTSA